MEDKESIEILTRMLKKNSLSDRIRISSHGYSPLWSFL